MEPDVAELRRSIARACRILALQGLAEDVLGHVSVRLGADRLLIRCRGTSTLCGCAPTGGLVIRNTGIEALLTPPGPSRIPARFASRLMKASRCAG